MSTLSKRDQLKASQELTTNTNPAKKFYKWESENKTFSYFLKGETKAENKNVLVDLPFRFVTLGRPLFCVKGFNEKLKLGLYSNEVRSVKDEMTVRYFDKNQPVIAKGTWEEVKGLADNVGGKYHLSIYGYDLDNKEIINIDVKGNGIGEWGNLFKKCSSRLADEVVIVKGYKDGKTGAVKYTYPTFELERVVSDDELDDVIEALDVLKAYHTEYFKNKNVEPIVEDSIEEDFLGDEGDLDF
jgi:hypothetical protein